jgi:hypothetical protein
MKVTMQRSLVLSTLCALSAFVVHSIGYVVGPGAGSVAFFPGFILFAASSWFVGRLFRRRWLAVAGLVGGLLGVVFWFLDWRLLYLVSVQLVQTESETGFIQLSGPFSLFLPVLAVATAVSAVLACWKDSEVRG